MFVDRVEIEIAAGNGGNGAVSFRREKFIPRGGPDGGDGGHGGSVVLRAQPGVDSLAALAHRKHWRAEHGQPGGSSDCFGRSAEDLILLVPPGTVVIDAGSGLALKDLVEPGQQVIAAHGGKGGKGNAAFKTSTNRAPRECTPGGRGEQRRLILELKVIADVGLIGKPNAGKSTLLARLSRAQPEIADYPFTTKYPNLGIVYLTSDHSFVLADLPGLIEGAHAGVGLGHEFLRHIQRAGILVHLVEPAPVDGSDPLNNYRIIRSELERYSTELGARPEIAVITKCELPGAEEVRAKLAGEIGREVLAISAVTGEGLDQLLWQITKLLSEQKQAGSEKITPALTPHS
ncbi:MAG TPA: GTPase ObgE [Pirellulales bacterium]|jgi:GTP-binding protein|nr:GTPase ObgE [Pirellulales bacterium]